MGEGAVPGREAIATVGMAHPWPLLRATGAPLWIVPEHASDFSAALEFVEPEFGPAVLAPVQLALDGAFDECRLVVFDREHLSAFLFIKELHRRGRLPNLAPIYLFDFIADLSPASRRHNRGQLDELAHRLQRDFTLPATSVRNQVVLETRLNDALNGLQRSRRRGLIDGASAKALLASRRSSAPGDVIMAARSVTPASSPGAVRVLLVPQGSDASTGVHELVRQVGGNVVDEEDYHGSRSVLATLSSVAGGDPFDFLLEQMQLAPGSDMITPLHEAFAWYQERLSSGDIDLAVVVTESSDQRRGWEVPHRRELAAANQIPFLHIHENLSEQAGTERAVKKLAQAIESVPTGGMA